MKTFKQIVDDAWEESGLSGSAPANVASCTGIQRRFVGWVRQAWRDVQEYRPDWPWMRNDFSFTTSPNKQTYTLTELSLTDIEQWFLKGTKFYKVSDGVSSKRPLPTTTYEKWDELYSYGPQQPSIPGLLFVRPVDRALMLHPIPDDEYRVSMRYQSQIVNLAANGDIPALPTNTAWDEIIKWRALYLYAFHDVNVSLLDEAEMEYERMIHALDNRYGTQISISGRPIA